MIADADLALIESARGIIRARYQTDLHAVGCAIRTRSGRIHLGVHLECHVGRIAVCAEAVAIGGLVTEGDTSGIETVVAVLQSDSADPLPVVVAPCGMCREMISDYAPDARVIVPGEAGPKVVTIKELLPIKYHRAENPHA